MLLSQDGERPRERLARLGPHALSDSELLAVLLGTGTRGQPVNALAERLLEIGGGLKALLHLDPQELSMMPGLGPARAAQLAAALELGRRSQQLVERRLRLRSPDELYRFLAPLLSALPHEVFHVLCFNVRNVLLKNARVAHGTTSACPVDPREVFAPALACRATAVVLAHNHPSGDPEPSQTDIALTEQLNAACHVLGIKLLDHLVIGDGRFFSFARRGWIDGLPRASGRPAVAQARESRLTAGARYR